MWIAVTLIAIGLIFGGVLLLKQTAKKFDLNAHQLDKIKKRNKSFDEEDSNNY